MAAESSTVAVPVKVRLHWMDMLRGSAIVLVMLWHSSAIPVLYGASMPAPVRAVNMFFLPFRMPTLMFLSGLLLPASLRKPLPVYYAGKFAAIGWPYLLFVVLDRFVVGNDNPWWHWRAYYATSYLWFLFFIGVYYVVAPLLRRLPPWAPVLLGAAIGLALPYGVEERLAYFSVFFFLGRWASLRRGLLDRLTRGRIVLVLALPAVLVGLASAHWGLALAYRVWLVPLSLAGTLVAIAGTQAIERAGHTLPALTLVGRNSIVYYVVHFPVMVGTMTALYALGVHGQVVVAVVELVVAAVVCTLLARLRHHAAVGWLFEAPPVLTRWIRQRYALAPRQGAAPRPLAAGAAPPPD
jgi:peptidoglycan/LPS O-acetylase OafA/YrhL